MRASAVLLFLLLSVACASPRDPASQDDDPDFLTREQILEPGLATLYDVVLRLRPQWLAQSPDAGPVPIYQGFSRVGEVRDLRSWDPVMAHSLEYLPPTEAAARGLGEEGKISGVIIIWTGPHRDE